MSTIADRLEQIRAHFGLSQGAFSLRVGWDRPRYGLTIRRLRAGEIASIRPKGLEQIESALGARREWLLFGTGQPFGDGTRLVEREAPPPPTDDEIEHVQDLDGPGRWKAFARRYWTFRAQASLALAQGVDEAALDAASDRLGAHHGDGPTEDQAKEAIEAYARQLAIPFDGREATAADFETPAPGPKKKLTKRRP